MSARRIVLVLFLLLLLGITPVQAAVLTLPGSLQSIGEEAFSYDDSLQIVVVPMGTGAIESRAFAESGIKKIYIPETVTAIADDAFDGTDGLTICSGRNTFARNYAIDMGFRWNNCGSFYEGANSQQISSAEYKAMLLDLLYDIAPGTIDYFNSKVTDYDVPIVRCEAVTMSWYAAVCLGTDGYNNSFDNSRLDSDEFWDNGGLSYELLFPDSQDDIPVNTERGTWPNEYIASALWNIWHSSPVTGLQVVPFDEETGSMRTRDPFTYGEAHAAVAALRDSISRVVPMTDNAAIHSGLVAEPTGSEFPRLTGFQLYGEEWLYPSNARWLDDIASWGFTSVRLMVRHDYFINDGQVDLNTLRRLDTVLQEAIESGIHVNLMLTTLPGHADYRVTGSFSPTGDFDLFVNEAKLNEARKIVRMLAERYKNVSSDYFSLSPLFEPWNGNLSTGCPFPEYDEGDVARVLDSLIGTIRDVDPDRLVICELGSPDSSAYSLISNKYDRVKVSFDFVDPPFAFADLTTSTDSDVDNCMHSIFKPSYPVEIYSVNKNLDGMVMSGCLPAGTVLDIYLSNSAGGLLTVSSGSEVIYVEELEDRAYETSYLLSDYYPYATSEKKLSILLSEDAEQLHFSGWAEISGMDVFLPDDYAVERWYAYSDYDAYLDGNPDGGETSKILTSRVLLCPNDEEYGKNITIHSDVTYTSDHLLHCSNQETMDAWGERTNELVSGCLLRFERAFTMADSVYRYYDDMLSMFDRYGWDWYSSDYSMITGLYFNNLDAELTRYGGYSNFDMGLLQVLQKHQ